MPYEPDVFDEFVQARVDDVAPGLVDAIVASLSSEFEVGAFSVRSVLMAEGGVATVRWAVDCVDSIREDRRNTYRELTVHGLTLVGGPERERVVQHYIDWAGVMSQLGITTSRPSAVDRDNVATS
jgi:hypothetical protein